MKVLGDDAEVNVILELSGPILVLDQILLKDDETICLAATRGVVSSEGAKLTDLPVHAGARILVQQAQHDIDERRRGLIQKLRVDWLCTDNLEQIQMVWTSKPPNEHVDYVDRIGKNQNDHGVDGLVAFYIQGAHMIC